MFHVLTHDCQLLYNFYTKREEYDAVLQSVINQKKDIMINWPSVVYSDTIRQCLTAYKTATCYLPPLPCACCVRACNNQHIHSSTIRVNEELPINLNLLKSNDPFLVNIFESKNDHVISHLSPSLNGLLL